MSLDILNIIAEREAYKKFNKLEYYEPYEFQKCFHHAEGGETYHTGEFRTNKGPLARIRALQAGNQSGKTLSAAQEAAFHLTGKYPEWWEGHRFNRPVKGTVCGVINDKTRDICQAELFGEPGSPDDFGTGAVPKSCIGEVTRKPGVPNAFDSVLVKHYTNGNFDGWSKIFFGSYQQDLASLMGTRMDFVWGDEEPPQEVHSQFLRSTLSTRGIIFYSFTPESGMTQLVYEFQEDLKPNMALVRATWDDAPHFSDPAYRHEAEMQFPEHEREMRRMGIPMMGTGLVWPIKEEDISVSPFQIPRHWPKLCAVDFGMDHPFAAVWYAWDRDSDSLFLYDCYKKSRKSEGRSLTIAEHASAIKQRGDWIPCIWPHDMNQEEPKSCKTLSQLFREEGVNMRPEHFTNPPAPGEKKGDIGVEVGIQSIMDRMQTGTFKVFSHLDLWFNEFRSYHRDTNGKIVKLRDDLMAATRYGAMSTRFAYTEPVAKKPQLRVVGSSNW